ncbi:hypothetical protein CBS101457_006905 [Exobasidium rhododendri]|nr:hypothetical protein CBS101457_006905 [Exobasidium rhododendri]
MILSHSEGASLLGLFLYCARRAVLTLGAVLTSWNCVIQTSNGASNTALGTHSDFVKTVDQGAFQGIRIGDDVDGFFGIPYARAPLGELRFALPVPVAPYRDARVRKVIKPGTACLQPSEQVANHTSEDCLFLNIYRPDHATADSKLPVMFWIHGGSWALGASTMSFYNGTALIRRSVELNEPIILVSINYRLGALGFLGGSSMLHADNEGTGVLNAGLHDQREALRWVQENIAAFGGDAEKVTIWGESAGANSVAAQMLADAGQSKGLFSRAIMQSGNQATLPRLYANASRPCSAAKIFMEEAGCTDEDDALACLRSVPSTRLNRANSLALSRGASFNPLRDDFFVQELPSKQLARGHFNRSVSFIHGNNLDEGTQLAAPFSTNLTNDAAFTAVIVANYGRSVLPIMSDILRIWPNDPALGQPNRPYYYGSSPNDTFFPNSSNGDISQYKRLSSFLQDTLFEAGRRQHLFAATSRGVSAWSYRFAQPTPENATFAKYQDTAALGVQHASDLPYVFGHPPHAGNLSEQPKTLRPFVTDNILDNITSIMTAAWIHFATHGNPNGRDVPEWQRYNAGPTDHGMGNELIFQPEGTVMQLDAYHYKETQWLHGQATRFGL